MKQCSSCKSYKDLHEFYKRSNRKDAYQPHCKACNKLWRKNNKLKIQEYRKQYICANKEELKEKRTAYYVDHKESINQYGKEWRKNNKEKDRLIKKNWRENNRAHVREYQANKMAHDINYKITRNLRSRLYNIVKLGVKAGSAVNDLGCTIDEFKQYIQSLFKNGMSWDNYGKWEMDHIIPLSSFDLSDREQFLKACHYTNIQPLWAEENRQKGNRNEAKEMSRRKI